MRAQSAGVDRIAARMGTICASGKKCRTNGAMAMMPCSPAMLASGATKPGSAVRLSTALLSTATAPNAVSSAPSVVPKGVDSARKWSGEMTITRL